MTRTNATLAVVTMLSIVVEVGPIRADHLRTRTYMELLTQHTGVEQVAVCVPAYARQELLFQIALRKTIIRNFPDEKTDVAANFLFQTKYRLIVMEQAVVEYKLDDLVHEAWAASAGYDPLESIEASRCADIVNNALRSGGILSHRVPSATAEANQYIQDIRAEETARANTPVTPLQSFTAGAELSCLQLHGNSQASNAYCSCQAQSHAESLTAKELTELETLSWRQLSAEQQIEWVTRFFQRPGLAERLMSNALHRCNEPLQRLLADKRLEDIGESSIEELLRDANSALDTGDRETARSLFRKAADLGNAEAHFALAQIANSSEQRAYHYSEAAKQGIQEALDPALDSLLFQAQDLKVANPKKALEVFEMAVKANPAIESGRSIDVIRMCVEPGEFDGAAFMDTYGIEEDQFGYSVWELAEEAANGGRFGNPNAELVLHLICHGGVVPFETELAVSHAYHQWKRKEIPRFNLCNFVSSRFGLGYCSHRYDREIEGRLSQLSYPAVTNRIWIVKGTNILPTCLETVWASGDNYEEYEDQFPSAKNFYDYPGKYWGKVVPISTLPANWGDTVSIPRLLQDCNLLKNGQWAEIENNVVTVNDPPNYPNTYRLLAEWGREECDKVVPGFAGTCHSLVFVVIDNAHAIYGRFYNTYAYITQNGNDYILPVTNNMEMEDFLILLSQS